MIFTYLLIPDRLAQSVTTDACLTADQGVSEFDPGPVRYFCEDWSWNKLNFFGHSPPFCWFIQEGLLSVKGKSMCTKYLLPLVQALLCELKTDMIIAADLDVKQKKNIKLFVRIQHVSYLPFMPNEMSWIGPGHFRCWAVFVMFIQILIDNYV